MNQRRRFIPKWLTLWLTLVLFGVTPVSLCLMLRDSRPDASAVLMAEVHGRALALDAHLEQWIARSGRVADELSALISQLPPGPIGLAAEGTLMLHLQTRLAEQRDLGEYAVVSPEGEVLLSTDGTHTSTRLPVVPEAAQVARRPAVLFLQTAEGGSRLAIGAAVHAGQALRAMLIADVRTDRIRQLTRSFSAGIRIDVIDANNQSLLQQEKDSDWLSLGAESRPGSKRIGPFQVAYAPLAQARAVVVATHRALLQTPWALYRWWLGAGGALLLLAAAVCAWRFSRRSD